MLRQLQTAYLAAQRRLEIARRWLLILSVAAR